MILPAMVAASTDERLRGEPLRLYLWLVCNQLDVAEFRPLKLTGVAFAVKAKRHTVSRSLKLLVTSGYIERKAVHQDGYHYRVRLTRAA